MAEVCQEHPCGIRRLCDELHKIGCGGDPSWLAVLLFVRNLVQNFSIYTDKQKKAIQQYIFGELAKHDSSETHLQAVAAALEEFLAENVLTTAFRDELESEIEAARSLAQSVNTFLQESLASQHERGMLLKRFGREAMETLDGGEMPSVMLPRLRGLISGMLHHYREEAQAWERKAVLLEKVVRVDPLLAPLHNRRALDSHMGKAVAAAQFTATPLAVLMIDVDNFKTTINDIYGHTVGDDVLRALAKIIEAHASWHGWFAARYGGDELVLVCELDEVQAQLYAEAIRLAVQRYEFRPRIDGRLAEPPIRFTVSIGVAVYRPGMTATDLVAAADKAMYAVKGTGRNNVACSHPVTPS